MPDWPQTIPQDLREALEATDHGDWRAGFRSWSKVHGLRFKLQWEADLLRRVGVLDQYRCLPMIQDRWNASHDSIPFPAHQPTSATRLGQKPAFNVVANGGDGTVKFSRDGLDAAICARHLSLLLFEPGLAGCLLIQLVVVSLVRLEWAY